MIKRVDAVVDGKIIKVVPASDYDAVVAALQALWTETKLAGNDNSRDYGWPKVREMVLAALPDTSTGGE